MEVTPSPQEASRWKKESIARGVVVIVLLTLVVYAGYLAFSTNLFGLQTAAIGDAVTSTYTVSTADDLNAIWDEAVSKAQLGEDVLVSLAGGIHTITEPLVMLSENDSSNNQGSIRLEGSADGSSVISGARKVSGWQRVDVLGRNDVYVASYNGPMIQTLSFGLGEQGTRARFPNKDADTTTYPRVRSFDAEYRNLTIDFPYDQARGTRALFPEDISQSPEIVVTLDGDLARMRIESITDTGNGYRIVPKEPERDTFFYTAFRKSVWSSRYDSGYAEPGSIHGLFAEGENVHAYWIENSLRLLDQPGEWFYNQATGQLFIIPPAGFNPSSGDVWVPNGTDSLFVAVGDNNKKLPALHISRVTFFMTDYENKLLPNAYLSIARGTNPPAGYVKDGPARAGRIGRFSGRSHTLITNNGLIGSSIGYEDPAAMYLENVEDITIASSRFLALSGGAIRAYGRANDVHIKGNLFEDVASYGVLFFNWSGDTIDYGKVDNVEVEDNRFDRVGRKFIGVPITFNEKDHSNVSIHHNDVYDAPYYAMNASTGINTSMNNNKIIRAMSMETDGGAIQISNLPQRVDPYSYAEISGNYIADVRDPEFMARSSQIIITAGIYVDGGYRTVVKGNYIENAPIGINYGCEHEGFLIYSNYLADTDVHEFTVGACPVEDDVNDGHSGRNLPIVPLTSETLNNVHSPDPTTQNRIKANAGVRSNFIDQWSSWGWLGGGTTPTPDPVPSDTHNISGILWLDDNRNGSHDNGEGLMSGRTIYLQENNDARTTIATAETSSQGEYSFTNLTPGTYRVTFPVPSDLERVTDDSAVVSLQADKTVNFGVARPMNYSISGFLWLDDNGNGAYESNEGLMSERTIYLLDNETRNTISTTQTSSQGQYNFGNLVPGNYRVTFPVPSDLVRTTDDSVPVSLQGDTKINFGVKRR